MVGLLRFWGGDIDQAYMAQLIFLGVCNLAGQWLYPIFGGYLYSAVELYGRKMTKKLLLHIGTTKTGNTSIHQALVHAKAKGDLGQVCYPLWRGDLHQARMAAVYCPDELSTLLPSLRGRYPPRDKCFRRMLQKYRKFIFKELRSAESAIISAETFSHLFSSMHAEMLREDLKALGYTEFHIVLYVRDPADFYLSSTSQSLRMSDEQPFIKDPLKFRYEFLRIAETWEQVFPGQLIVRKYPTASHFDVLEDFSNLLERRMGIVLPCHSIRKNSSLSTEAMQVLHDYRQTFWAARVRHQIL